MGESSVSLSHSITNLPEQRRPKLSEIDRIRRGEKATEHNSKVTTTHAETIRGHRGTVNGHFQAALRLIIRHNIT